MMVSHWWTLEVDAPQSGRCNARIAGMMVSRGLDALKRNLTMKRFVISTLTAAGLALAPVAVSAHGWHGGHWGWHHGGIGPGAAVALGLGTLAIGAGAIAAAPYYGWPGYSYSYGYPAYPYPYAYSYAPSWHWTAYGWRWY